jgi:NAD(P)-dependent dehydrogenase (short-subunit alcohol dehydrogenase family)
MEFLRLTVPALEQAPSARIVSTGSMLTQKIPFDIDNWLAQSTYRARVAYAMSKHAAEILGFELDRRLLSSGSRIRSVVTHPGGAIDALTPDRPPLHQRSLPIRLIAPDLAPIFAGIVQGKQSAAQAAIAAMATSSLPTQPYIGPRRGAAGKPVFATPVPSTFDERIAARMWDETEAILARPILPVALTE